MLRLNLGLLVSARLMSDGSNQKQELLVPDRSRGMLDGFLVRMLVHGTTPGTQRLSPTPLLCSSLLI